MMDSQQVYGLINKNNKKKTATLSSKAASIFNMDDSEEELQEDTQKPKAPVSYDQLVGKTKDLDEYGKFFLISFYISFCMI